MTALATFFQNAVPISAERHALASVRAPDGYGYARNANAVPLVLAEFPHVVREYPILFGPDESRPVPLALLGLRRGENIFVAASGSWTGNYIPAFIRRYPFLLVERKDSDDLVACVDEALLDETGGQGQRLFDDEGAHTDFLDRALQFLRHYRAQYRKATDFGTFLQEHGLLEPAKLEVKLSTGERMTGSGLRMLERRKFDTISGTELLEFRKRGYLEPAFQIFHSMGNIDALARRTEALGGLASPIQ